MVLLRESAPEIGNLVVRRRSFNVLRRVATWFLLIAGLNGGCSDDSAQTELPPAPTLSLNSPIDQPVDAEGDTTVEDYCAAIAPYVEKARETYPEAKKRFLVGLPAGQHFFAVTKLQDGSGTTEQVFVAVASIKGDRITGRIASVILGVKGSRPATLIRVRWASWSIG